MTTEATPGNVRLNDGLGAWLPIATVPRSELAGQILTFRDYGGLEESYPVFRGKSGPWFQTSFWSPKFSLWVGWPLNVQPTHWMPLPAGPVRQAPNVEVRGGRSRRRREPASAACRPSLSTAGLGV